MTRIVADLHVHSRYALATSKSITIPALSLAARAKGIDVLATGDFTHPEWLAEMRSDLRETAPGVYACDDGVRFLLGAEVSCIWRQGGRGRRVHLLLLAPHFGAVERINAKLADVANLASDGRPMLKLSARSVAEITWEADERCFVIPAHVWTPWYGLYGSKSGFDSMEECFLDLAPRIRAIETGLSSDPAMNWAVGDLNGRAIVSFSDAHSAANLGRELTVLDAGFTYEGITDAMRLGNVVETIEFHPQHGKYHLNGHRKCGVRLAPSETPSGGRCPVCGKPLTLGVLQRAADLSCDARKSWFDAPPGPDGLVAAPPGRAPFRRLAPLRTLLSQALQTGVGSRRVARAYDSLVEATGSELAALLSASPGALERAAGPVAASVILAARAGRVEVDPGYDGVYGTVRAIAAT